MTARDHLISRVFAGDTGHARAIADFLGRAQDITGRIAGWHPGDFWWQAYRPSCAAVFTTYSRDEQILAVILLTPPDEIELILNQTLTGTDEGAAVAHDILKVAMAEADLRGEINMSVAGNDDRFAAIARDAGFTNSGTVQMRTSWLSLTGQMPVVLPDGFRLIAMNSGADLDARVELHRNVWAPSKFTRTDYDHLRAAGGYGAHLDLVALANDGQYASYAMGWYDPVSRTGLLEPVGTQSRFRGIGLGKAVITTVMNQMKRDGAIGCWVSSRDMDVAANALYHSAGFRMATRWQVWRRTL